MNAICLVIDRLHVGYVGAYGNAWIGTPALDRLAAEGFAFDAAFIESPELGPLYEAYWLGRHAMGPLAADTSRSLPALLSARSVNTRLLTDDPAVAGHRLAGTFGQIIELNLPEPDAPAQTVEDTLLGRCFAQALELLDSAREPFLVWCHVGALGRAWDAPRALRLANCDAGDPEPPDTVAAPDKMLPANYDPDELLAFSQVYAAQVCVLDACLGVVRDWLTASPIGRETLLVVTSARGFPLGEHLRVGPCDGALHAELVHVPMLFRLPDGLGASDRCGTLVQPSDLAPTLSEWFGVPPEPAGMAKSLLPTFRGESDGVHDRAGILGYGTERAMVTPAWHLRQASSAELYLRPDDRWGANDVADRCPDVVEALAAKLSQYEQTMQSNQITSLEPLDPLLLVGPE